MPPSDKTAIQCVIEVDQERIRLEKEAEILATKEDIGKTGSIRNHISTVPFKISFLSSLNTPYTRDATFLFTSQIRNNLTRRVREWINNINYV